MPAFQTLLQLYLLQIMLVGLLGAGPGGRDPPLIMLSLDLPTVVIRLHGFD